jgi:hypothetical protein
MAKLKITVEIDEEIVRSLGQRFPDINDKNKLVGSHATLALSEWEQWFAARLRPKSISALSQERIRMIFQDPSLYAGRHVTRGLLFNQFNFPYGEAAYLERVFSELDQPNLIKVELRKVVENLNSQLSEWEADEDHRPDQLFTIEVNKLGQHLLQSIMQKAKEENQNITPTEKVQAVHGYYNYTFSEEESRIVVTKAQEMLEMYS